MRVYLAHPIGTYGSARERTAIASLTALGHTVVNPAEAQYARACGADMARWVALAQGCDALALMPFADGAIGAGAAMEARAALDAGQPVFLATPDLATWAISPTVPRALTIAQTRDRNATARAAQGAARVQPDTARHADLLARVPPFGKRACRRPVA